MIAAEPPPSRRDNGLAADRYVALADVDPRLGDHLLDLLRLADIPAYLEPPGDPRTTVRYATPGPVERLFVQAASRAAARAVVVAAAEEAGGSERSHGSSTSDPSSGSGRNASEIDAEFARIVAGFDAPPARREPTTRGPADDGRDFDPVSAAMLDAAARQRAAREHPAAEGDEAEEHFEPPAPPPFPIPAAATVGALVLALFGLFLIARGDLIGFSPDTSFPLGVVALLTGLGLLVARLRSRGVEDDGDDDGAVV